MGQRAAKMEERIFTVPNQLTFLRMGFLPFFIIAIHYEHYGWALGILVVSGMTDGLDGLLARTLNQRTPLGAYLDPIADKLLLSSSFFVLALKHKIAWWLAILVLGRDVMILTGCAAILLTVGYRPFPPSIYGKAATTVEILLVFLVLVIALAPNPVLIEARMICGYLAGFLAVFTGFHYSFLMAARLHAE